MTVQEEKALIAQAISRFGEAVDVIIYHKRIAGSKAIGVVAAMANACFEKVPEFSSDVLDWELLPEFDDYL